MLTDQLLNKEKDISSSSSSYLNNKLKDFNYLYTELTKLIQ